MRPMLGVGVAMVAMAFGAVPAGASGLNRADSPVVLKGADVPTLEGTAPGDVVAFRYDNGWRQAPVQVDEVKMFNITKAYPETVGTCSDPCYSWTGRTWYQRVYADPNTLTGAETDEVVNGVTNHANLDADDELALMAKDLGGAAPGGTASPDGVIGNGVEVMVADPIDGGNAYVYLFQRDAGAAQPLDPSAGKSYVTYQWRVNHIQANHPDDALATQRYYKDEYRFTGYDGSKSGAGNPETSFVQTADYRREMTGRWSDNVMKIFRGSSTGENILDRHDASISFDQTCVRWQGTFDVGEMTYITSKVGPIRAIRDYMGTNSGPLTEKRDIFYESSTDERIDLRVHPVPGPETFFAFNANAVGLRYSEPLGTARIDGLPDPYAGHGAILPNTYTWETVDKDTLTGLPTDPPAAGALTIVDYFDTNNADPIAHTIWHDGGNGGCNNQPYYGTSALQAPLVMSTTDVSGSTQSTYLVVGRNIHYEAPGTANGPVRQQQDTTPLAVTATGR